MEWKLPVNEVLKEYITKLNYTLVPPGCQGGVHSTRLILSLSKLIDAIGEQSAAAQGLNKVITTAENLHVSPAHSLYLLKDPHADGGLGEVIGLLKVGRKRLFLFDEYEKPWEVEPLCVLDFFVVPDRQRHGYGKILFDYMLQDLQCSPLELAIDGPSPNMERFLSKYYGFERFLRQNNNFAVSQAFFSNADNISKSGRSTPAVSTPAIGRFAASKPPSIVAAVIHGDADGSNSYITCGTSSRPTTPVFEPPAGLSVGAAEPGTLTRTPERPNTLHVETAEYGAGPARSPTGSFRSPTGRALSPTGPALSPTGPARSPTGSFRSPTGPALSPTGPPRSPSGRALSPTAPARSPDGRNPARRDSQLTDRGYFDIKFYHHKLF